MNFKEITRAEAETLNRSLQNAWKDPSIPQRQYEIAVKNEIASYARGGSCLPYDTFVRALLKIPQEFESPEKTLLEIGASAGYYSEVMKIAGFKYKYHALDYSEHYRDFAKTLYPDVPFIVADARKTGLPDKSYDIVVSGCCIVHILEAEDVIRETVRLSKKYVMFARTPVTFKKAETVYYTKEAYGVPCLEIHYWEPDLMKLWTSLGLRCIHIEELFRDQGLSYAHRTYLFEIGG